MKADRILLAARSWAIPALCGLLVLHHEFKHGRFSNVRRLEWTKSAVDVHFSYGIANAVGVIIESLETVITVHQNGAVGISLSDSEALGNHLEMLHFLAGEVSREALRWSDDLAEWNQGTLDDDVKSSTLALACVVVAHPFTNTNLVVEKCRSNAADIRKIMLMNEVFCTELTPSGEHGVNVFQYGLGANENYRHRYVEHDLRIEAIYETNRFVKFIGHARNRVLMLALLPVATLAYLGDKMQTAERRMAGEFIEYLPDSPLMREF